MKMELNHENHEKNHENSNLSKKHHDMKTEISGQNFPKFSPAAGKIVKKNRLRRAN